MADIETIKINVEKLNFYYDNFQALKDINLQIINKKITAIIGPSGCGKSTLLRCFNKIYMLYDNQFASGSITYNGNNILSPTQDLYQLRSRIGMVFQKPTPFHMSIFNNIAFGIKLYNKLPKDELHFRVESALKEAALWDEVKDKLDESGYNLSGGQQQRLCIARAIAVRPEVILLDEPTSTLDPISTGNIEELIKKLKENYTIVMVTHNLQQAKRISDYLIYMFLGNLIEYGTTEAIFNNPQREETRDYIKGKF